MKRALLISLIVVVALLIGSSAPFFASMSSALAQDGEYESFSSELTEQLLVNSSLIANTSYQLSDR